jgi:hypothetical protein
VDVPGNQPLSADIEDRRNGTTWAQKLSARVHELMSNVQDDYNDSFPDKSVTMSNVGQVQAPPAMGTDAAANIHAKIHKLLGGY